MMLVLAVRTDRRARVRAGAARTSRPDEIAEAFAAARGIASPTQLRTVMKQDGRDLARRSSGRWRRRGGRSRCSAGASGGSCSRWCCVLGALFVVVQTVAGCSRRPTTSTIDGTPTCGTDDDDDPHGAVGARRRRRAVRRVAAGRVGARRRSRSTRTQALVLARLGPAPATDAVEVTLLPPRRVRRRRRDRGAERRGRDAPLRADRAAAARAARARAPTCSPAAASRTRSTFDGDAHRVARSSTPTARSPSSPAADAGRRRSSDTTGLAPVRRRRTAVPGRLDDA